MMKKFITIKENSYDEFVEKKSTFITHLVRITSEEEAREFIQKMKKKHYDATHVCSCYVVGDNNEITRANDDGEPSGTAGAPMLDVLVKNEIKNVCATVIRYFGGTKLGTGGLVRAYGGGVINALKNATLVERKDALEIRLELDYSLNGKIEYEIEKTNFIVNNLEYTDKIIYTIYVMEEDYDSFQSWIANLTNGQFKILSTHEKQLEFDIKD
ncbi:MAG: YigZ family protein [Gemella morbillorum]|nr:YigZ family protein [Gemella morbillorum]